jgi:hypothetical protein
MDNSSAETREGAKKVRTKVRRIVMAILMIEGQEPYDLKNGRLDAS